MEKELQQIVRKVVKKHFDASVRKMTRMKNGLCNEVYVVDLEDQEVVVRLNKDLNEMEGSEVYIPLFRSKGVKVPEILASDYSRRFVPYYYHIQNKLAGENISDVIATLSAKQLGALAGEIANIFKKLQPIPTNGRFGFVYGKAKGLKKTLTSSIRAEISTTIERGHKTGVLDDELERALKDVFKKNKPYFDAARSIFYYDDMSSKNVMVHKGKFNGLVDLDGVAYGDYLETVGRIKASWYGTRHGKIYTDAIMDALKLSKKKREMVVVYAIIHRISWMCENGIQFNQNTSGVVDWKQAKRDRKIAIALLEELS